MKESLLRTLAELTALDGVSGFEQDVVRYLRDAFSVLAEGVEVDGMGNVYARREGDPTGPRLMIAAHSDEIGGIVKSVDPQGFLRFDVLGGLVPSLLVGRRVRVRGHLGVIGTKSAHLQTREQRGRVPTTEELYIDVGVDSAEEVAALGIAMGDPVAYYSPLLSYTNSDRLCGKSIDNRLGCAILLELFRQLESVSLAGTLHGVVCVQEEVGMRGARVAAYRLRPDYAVVVDTIMAAGTPDVDYHKEFPARIGEGPVLLMSNAGHIAHPAVNRYLVKAAEECGVKLQPCAVVKAGTDAVAIHLSGEGVPASGIHVPRRYSHSPVCTMDINDAVSAVTVLAQFTKDMGQHTDIGFLSQIEA